MPQLACRLQADAQYIPPGRLRHYDLIVFDECSQPDDHVWREMRTALRELSPGPFIVFVGDFQQLQPIQGSAALHSTLLEQVSMGVLKHIDLKQHPFARCTDPDMLDFLSCVRCEQPSRAVLADFFRGRRLSRDLTRATQFAIDAEVASTQRHSFTFLTVTNQAASMLNITRLWKEFRIDENDLRSGYPGDPAIGGPRMVFVKGSQGLPN